MQREADGGLHENAYPRFHRVSPIEPTAPWAMFLADDDGVFRVLCFDFDGKERDGSEAVERAVDDSEVLASMLVEADIPHVVCRSSAGGGRHIWVGLSGCSADVVGRLARSARANFRSLDHGMLLNPRQGAARPPLSPHRDGSTSTVLRGDPSTLVGSTVSSSMIDDLAERLDARAPSIRADRSVPSGPTDARHTSHRPLTAWGEGHMATIDGGSNPSWTAFMCLLAAAGAGWSFADVQQAAATAPGLEHFRTKNVGRGRRRARDAREAEERLERQWEKAQQYATLQSRVPRVVSAEPKDLSDLEQLVTSAEQLLTRFRVSPGRWGRSESAMSERTVLTAIAYLTLHTGKDVVGASIRDLAVMAGVGRTTAADALIRLQSAGYIDLVRRAGDGNASEWRISSSPSTGSGTVRSQPLNNPRPPAGSSTSSPADLFNRRAVVVSVIEEELADGRHDLFTRGGLGHSAGKVFALLRSRSAMTVESVSRAVGLGARYAGEILSRLRASRLIVKDGAGWSRSKRDLRASAARRLGVAGVLKARAERYSVEREVWAWWQAEVSTMNAAPRDRPRRPHVSSRTLMFVETPPGERIWPRYPRDGDGRGDHREARYWADNGMLAPDSLWWSSRAA